MQFSRKKKIYYTNPANPPIKLNTYFIKSKYFPSAFTDELFLSRGNWIKVDDHDLFKNNTSSTMPIDFVWLDSKKYRQDSKYNKLLVGLTNFVNQSRSSITRKDNLMTNLNKIAGAEKYIIPQLNINITSSTTKNNIETLIHNFYKPEHIYIVKPVGGWLGAGIKIFSKLDEIVQHFQNIINVGSGGSGDFGAWVIQEYITNPLLLTKSDGQNYKFHIRHYYIYQPKPKPSYFFAKGAFAIAKKPYIAGNWLDADIHDTHFSDGEIWPDNMFPVLLKSQLNVINKQLHELYGYIDSIIHAGCYNRAKSCMALFGVESDNVQKTLLKVQSAMAISQGLQAVGESIDSFKQLGAVIQASTVFQKANNVIRFKKKKNAQNRLETIARFDYDEVITHVALLTVSKGDFVRENMGVFEDFYKI